MPSATLFAAALAAFLVYAYPRLRGLVVVLVVVVGVARVTLGALRLGCDGGRGRWGGSAERWGCSWSAGG
ncbi:MAG: hypothetical protein IPJ41_13470 [Phycisphaerales bacterium]|nr:hypothetical protein [Phycisphaerales bacterium]